MLNERIARVKDFLRSLGATSLAIPSLITNYFQFALKMSLMFDLKIVYYFSKTSLGYTFYCFCVTMSYTGAFWLPNDSGHLDNLGVICWCAVTLIWTYALGSSLLFMILLRNRWIRQSLYNLLGESYVTEHLGNHPAWKSTLQLAKPVLVIAAADTLSEWNQSFKNKHDADNYVSVMQKANKDPDPKIIGYMYRRESFVRYACRKLVSARKKEDN